MRQQICSLVLFCLALLSSHQFADAQESLDPDTYWKQEQHEVPNLKPIDVRTSTAPPPFSEPHFSTEGGAATSLLPTPRALPEPLEFEKERFPQGPPEPLPSNKPLPISSAPRWLHSAVRLGSMMYVYGGVSSYDPEHGLYNDMWVFNNAEETWVELQSSYIPSFPNLLKKPEMPKKIFKPGDVPATPAFRAEPVESNDLKVRLSNERQSHEVTTKPQRVVPLIHLQPIPRLPMKTPSLGDFTEFLQMEDEQVTVSKTNTSQRNKQLLRLKSAIETSKLLLDEDGQFPAQGKLHAEEIESMFLETLATISPSLNTDPADKPAGAGQEEFNKDTLAVPDDLWTYDLSSKEWLNVQIENSAHPGARWLHTACAINDAMVVFGGVSFTGVILNDLWTYMPDDNIWIEAQPSGQAILPREGHTAVAFDDDDETMVVFGGVSYGYLPFDDLWAYNPVNNKWRHLEPSGDIPPPRWLHTAALRIGSSSSSSSSEAGSTTGSGSGAFLQTETDVASSTDGGHFDQPSASNGDAATDPNSVYLQLIQGVEAGQEGKQKAKGNARHRQKHRRSHAHNHGTVNNGEYSAMYVFGGVTRDYVPLDDLWKYTLATNTWEQVNLHDTTPPFPRMLHTSAILGSKLYIMQGVMNNIALEDVWEFDFEAQDGKGTWESLPTFGQFPFARQGATVITVGMDGEKAERPTTELTEKQETDRKEKIENADEPFIGPLNFHKPWLSPRPERYRKVADANKYIILFGGAGHHVEMPEHDKSKAPTASGPETV